jgi:hypothetical protein
MSYYVVPFCSMYVQTNIMRCSLIVGNACPTYQNARCHDAEIRNVHNHYSGYNKFNLNFHESVHRDTTMKMTNKMHYID